MLAKVAKESDAGWTVALGNMDALADRISQLVKTPEVVCNASAAALSFAKQHGFEAEFIKRNTHLQRIADTD